MAFYVNLYSVDKRTNSTAIPEGNGVRLSCVITEPCDIMAPTFKFKDIDPNDKNYCYVDMWRRYYWIDGWTYDHGFWVATCSIDPLASWRYEIGNMTEYILRSAAANDPIVMDTTYPLSAKTETDRIIMSGWDVPMNPLESCHVVGVVGGNGLTRYYVIEDLAAFGAAMFGDTLWNSVLADDPGYVEGNIPNFMKAQFNPLQYVVSCTWYPFMIAHSADKYPVKFGYFDSGYTAYLAPTNSFTILSGQIDIPDHPQVSRGRYLNFAPFTRLKITAFPWGEIDLDTTKFANMGYIRFHAVLEVITGSTKLYIANGLGDVILTLVGQMGVTEQLSQVLKDNLATVTGGLSAIAGAGALFSGNIIGGLATIASGIGNAVSSQYPDVSTTGTNGARIAATPSQISLLVTHQYVVGEDRQNRGRPLCQRRKLSSIPGYQMISDPDVKIGATKAEIDMIKKHMTDGYFYE